MERVAYPTDLTDVHWLILEPYVRTSGLGRPPTHSKREGLNAIYYQARAGCAWRLLPHDFPLTARSTNSLRPGAKTGRGSGCTTDCARKFSCCTAAPPPREPGPRHAVGAHGRKKGGCYGYDAGKQVAGRKRHVVVDTLGLLLAVQLQPASLQDPTGAEPVC